MGYGSERTLKGAYVIEMDEWDLSRDTDRCGKYYAWR